MDGRSRSRDGYQQLLASWEGYSQEERQQRTRNQSFPGIPVFYQGYLWNCCFGISVLPDQCLSPVLIIVIVQGSLAHPHVKA